MVMVRRLYFFSERIQWTWLGQRPQAVVEDLILITSLVRLSMAGVQLILRCPSGQTAGFRSQSMRNWLASMPCSVLACHFTSKRPGPMTSIPYRGFLLTRMGAVIEPEPSQVVTRGELSLPKIRMDRLRHRLIGRRSSGRGHMGDQVRALFLTGFGEMHFIAGPPRLALFA